MNNCMDDHARVSVPDAKQRWLELLTAAVRYGTFVKLTLSRPVGAEASLEVRSQRLAGQLGFELDQPRMDTNEHE